MKALCIILGYLMRLPELEKNFEKDIWIRELSVLFYSEIFLFAIIFYPYITVYPDMSTAKNHDSCQKHVNCQIT